MNTAIITNDGLLIPKEWLSGFDQFEIFREGGLIVIKSAQVPKIVLQVPESSTDNSATVMSQEYAEAMQSYLSHHAQALTEFSQPYPKREEIYDRPVFLR